MVHGTCSLSQLFFALFLGTGLLAVICVLLASTPAPTPAELPGGSLRRLSGAFKGRHKAVDGPPPPGITISYTPEEGYRGQEGQDKWVDQQIFRGKRRASWQSAPCGHPLLQMSNRWLKTGL